MYLLKLLSRHIALILWLSSCTLVMLGGVWGFDFQKLAPQIILKPETITEIRMGLTLILPSAFLFSLLLILTSEHKRITIENTELRNRIEDISQKLDEHTQELARLKRKTSGLIPPPIKGIAD